MTRRVRQVPRRRPADRPHPPAQAPTTYTPPVVAEWAGKFHNATGLDVDVSRPADTRWRLTMANERVHTTMDFKSTGRRVIHCASTLSVDGRRVELADNLDDLARIFRDPDRHGAPQPPAEPLPPFPPERPADDAPAFVRQQYTRLANQLDGTGLRVRLGLNDHHLWLIGVETDRATVRVGIGQHNHIWQIVGLRVIVDGLDHSDEVKGDVAAAVALLAPHSSEAAPGAPAVAGPAAAARSNSVETRRATVIRN